MKGGSENEKTLCLILALVLAVILCVSCGQKKEEEKKETTEGLVTYTIYNRTGETIEKLTLTDNNSQTELTANGIPDGDKHEVSLRVTLENGAPSLRLTFETKTSNYSELVMQKDVPITLLPVAGEGEHILFTEPKE